MDEAEHHGHYHRSLRKRAILIRKGRPAACPAPGAATPGRAGPPHVRDQFRPRRSGSPSRCQASGHRIDTSPTRQEVHHSRSYLTCWRRGFCTVCLCWEVGRRKTVSRIYRPDDHRGWQQTGFDSWPGNVEKGAFGNGRPAAVNHCARPQRYSQRSASCDAPQHGRYPGVVVGVALVMARESPARSGASIRKMSG